MCQPSLVVRAGQERLRTSRSQSQSFLCVSLFISIFKPILDKNRLNILRVHNLWPNRNECLDPDISQPKQKLQNPHSLLARQLVIAQPPDRHGASVDDSCGVHDVITEVEGLRSIMHQ